MQIQNLIYFNTIQFKSIIILSIKLLVILFCFVLFKQKYVSKLCPYWNYFRSNFFLHHGLGSSDTKFDSFQFHTHAHFIPGKKDFWYIKVRRYNIFNFILFYIIFCKQKYVLKLCQHCQFALFQVLPFCHHGLRYTNAKSNLLQFNSTFSIFELFQV